MIVPLRWDDIGHAVDEDGATWTINSEHTRGEGRLYFVEQYPRWASDVRDAYSIDLAHHDRRVVRRRVEQLRRLRGES